MKATKVYELALTSLAANNPTPKRLAMAGPLVRVLAQIVVRHDAEAEPHRKRQAQSPGKDDAPEHPVRHAENEDDSFRIALVTHQEAGRHAPDQRREPHAQEQHTFAARMAKKLLLFAGIQGRFFHALLSKYGVTHLA